MASTQGGEMNKLIRLSPTGIEYGDYAWNFASGCGNNTDGKCNSGGFNCWAYPITQRFADRYPNGFNPTIYPEALLSPLYLKKPSRILCAFMGDLFWDCPEFNPWREIVLRGEDGRVFFEGSLRDRIFMTAEACPQHTFLFLTKQPQNLLPWSPFPENCGVGVTATDLWHYGRALDYLRDVVAHIKYLSLEPLLSQLSPSPVALRLSGINQVIIGAQTKPYKPPEIEWVREIVVAADRAGANVFLKDNLKWPRLSADGALPFYKRVKSGTMELRQEIPKQSK